MVETSLFAGNLHFDLSRKFFSFFLIIAFNQIGYFQTMLPIFPVTKNFVKRCKMLWKFI